MADKKQPEDLGSAKWENFVKNLEDDKDSPEADKAEGLTYPSHEELDQQINALEIKLNDYKEQALRAQAEMENVRRRAERDVQNEREYSNRRILTDLLPVVDSLKRGLEGKESVEQASQALREGMVLTLGVLEKVLERHGVTAIIPEKGETFNPTLHEAMSMQPNPGAKANTILQVLQNGYQLSARVIRPAMVIVVS